MKKTRIVLITFLLCISLIGCTERKNRGNETLIWRIAAFGNNSEWANGMIETWEEPLNALLKEKNAEYQVKIVPFSDTGENTQIEDLKLLKKNKEQTDVISLLPEVSDGESIDKNSYKEAIEQELLASLTEWKDTNEEVLMKSFTPYDFDLANYQDQLYGISSNIPYISGVAYHKGLLEEYGINPSDINQDMLANEDIFTKIKNQTNTIPLQYLPISAMGVGYWVVPQTNNLAWVKGEGFVSLSQTKAYKNYLQQCLSLKQQGLFEQTPSSKSGLSFLESSGATIARRDIFEVTKTETSSPNKTQYVVVPNVTSPQLELYWGDHKAGIASWTEHKDNAEDFLLKLYTDKDIANLIQYGVKGQDYELDEQQHVVVTSSNVGVRYAGYQFTNPKITYSSVYEEEDKVAYATWFYETYGDEFPAGFRLDPSPVANEVLSTNRLLTTDFVNSIGGDSWNDRIIAFEMEDMDSFLNDLNTELNDAGMQKIVEEANRQYQAWLKETN